MSKSKKFCKCGCGLVLKGKRSDRKFYNHQHRNGYHDMKRRWRRLGLSEEFKRVMSRTWKCLEGGQVGQRGADNTGDSESAQSTNTTTKKNGTFKGSKKFREVKEAIPFMSWTALKVTREGIEDDDDLSDWERKILRGLIAARRVDLRD